MSVPTNLIPTKITGLQEYTGSSTLGYLPYVLDGRTYKVQFANLAAVGAVPSTRLVATGTGLTGGGDLSQDRTIAIANGGVGFAQLADSGVTAGTYGSGSSVPVVTVDAKGRVTSATTAPLSISGYVPDTRLVGTDASLTGGGPLSSNLTLGVNYYTPLPQALGTASAGVSTAAARGDHVHPAVDLSDATQTQGALPLGRGGTGDALSPVAGAVVYSTGTKFALADPGLPGQVLTSAGTGEPYWQTISGTGTVTSVAASGGTTGLTFTGSPITTAGTLTLGGTLAVASGGTGSTTTAGARTNLGAAASGANSDITALSGITGAIGTPTYIQFDSGAGTTLSAGRMWYDQITGAFNLGMGNGNITQQVGEELFVYGKASAAITDSPLQIVYQTGTVGGSGVITFAPTVSGITDGVSIVGVATESIAHNDFGRVTAFGVVRGVTTDGAAYGETWADGDTIWYNPVTGNPTNIKPSAPNIKVSVGVLIKAGSGGSGSIQVEISHGSVLGGTDSNVQLTSVANNDLLQYSGSLGYWRNLAASSVSVGTATNLAGGAGNQIAYQTGSGATGFIAAPTTASTYLSWNGTGFAWAAASGGSGTVTSVDVSGGTTGLTFTGGPVTTSGTITAGGTLAVANGGTGAATLTGILKGNGTSAFTAAASADVITTLGYTPGDLAGNNTWSGTNTFSGNVSGTSTSVLSFSNTLAGNLVGRLLVDYVSGNSPSIRAYADSVVSGTGFIQVGSRLAFNNGVTAEVGSSAASTAGIKFTTRRANTPITFQTSPVTNDTLVTAMTIFGGGNVSIGNTSNAYKLDVTGDVRFTGRLVPNVQSLTSAATVTPDATTDGLVAISAQAVSLAVAAPSGTPLDGQRLMFRIKDNGTSQTISWDAAYIAGGAALPTTTTAGKWAHIGFIYNATNSKWMCVAVAQEA